MPNADVFWCVAVGPSNELEQGDIIKKCPCPFPSYDPGFDPVNPPSPIPIPVFELDIVVTTQSCDLPKVDWVLVCPIKPLTELTGKGKLFMTRDAKEQLRQGIHPAAFLIQAEASGGPAFGELVVEFRAQALVPKLWLMDFAKKQGRRLRLQPPFREAFAQHFGAFFSRVALPDPPSTSDGPSD
jgi:hypothetical protein